MAPRVQAALTQASAATLDRLLRPLRRHRPRQPRRLAPALASLRAQVPLRTWSEWAGVAPGALQGDLVLHCGESTGGRYCATLVAVDVATTWTTSRTGAGVLACNNCNAALYPRRLTVVADAGPKLPLVR